MATKLNINAIRDNSVTAIKLEKGAIKEAAELLSSLNSSNNPLSFTNSVFAITDNTGTWGLQSLDSLRATLETSYDTKYIFRSSEDSLRVAAAWTGIDSASNTSIYFDLDDSESNREYMIISGLVAYGQNDQDGKFYLYRPSKASILDILNLTQEDIGDIAGQWFEYAYFDDEWLKDAIIDDVDMYMTDYYLSSWISEVSRGDLRDGNPWYIPLCKDYDNNLHDTDFPGLYATPCLMFGDDTLTLPAGNIVLDCGSSVRWESDPGSWGYFLYEANYKDHNGNIVDVPLLCLHNHGTFDSRVTIRYLAEITATSEGKIKCAGIIEPSDIALKNKLSEIDVDFNALKSISKAYYTYKDDDEQKQRIGVIAQEVQKYYPEIVNKGSDGYLSVDYSKLSVIALKAIDMLDDRLKKIEEKLGI